LAILAECAQDEESVVIIGNNGGHGVLMKLMGSADEEIGEVFYACCFFIVNPLTAQCFVL
jgi:hypothetical protein